MWLRASGSRHARRVCREPGQPDPPRGCSGRCGESLTPHALLCAEASPPAPRRARAVRSGQQHCVRTRARLAGKGGPCSWCVRGASHAARVRTRSLFASRRRQGRQDEGRLLLCRLREPRRRRRRHLAHGRVRAPPCCAHRAHCRSPSPPPLRMPRQRAPATARGPRGGRRVRGAGATQQQHRRTRHVVVGRPGCTLHLGSQLPVYPSTPQGGGWFAGRAGCGLDKEAGTTAAIQWKVRPWAHVNEDELLLVFLAVQVRAEWQKDQG